MLGRLAELERLADVLNFSKGRMADKVTEFQEKYEFSRLTSSQPQAPQYPTSSFMGGADCPVSRWLLQLFRGIRSSLAEFSEFGDGPL